MQVVFTVLSSSCANYNVGSQRSPLICGLGACASVEGGLREPASTWIRTFRHICNLCRNGRRLPSGARCGADSTEREQLDRLARGVRTLLVSGHCSDTVEPVDEALVLGPFSVRKLVAKVTCRKPLIRREPIELCIWTSACSDVRPKTSSRRYCLVILRLSESVAAGLALLSMTMVSLSPVITWT